MIVSFRTGNEDIDLLYGKLEIPDSESITVLADVANMVADDLASANNPGVPRDDLPPLDPNSVCLVFADF